jgi:very-short-patch-repair endonuclease
MQYSEGMAMGLTTNWDGIKANAAYRLSRKRRTQNPLALKPEILKKNKKAARKAKLLSNKIASREIALRKKATAAEKRLYKALAAIYGKDIQFQRGMMCEGDQMYIIDIYHAPAKLAIEADGSSHIGKEGYDYIRGRKLALKGIDTIRISNDDIFGKLEDVLLRIQERISIRLAAISRENKRALGPA